MTFQDAIISVINDFGKDIFTNVSVVNILSDYNGYEESKAFRIILRIIISEGYIEQIRMTKNWELNCSKLIERFVNNTGFQEDKAVYVINSIAIGLGLITGKVSYSIENSTCVAQSDFDYTKTEAENGVKGGIKDEYGVVYSKDGVRLLACKKKSIVSYEIKEGTKIICDSAFADCKKLKSIKLPHNDIAIGAFAFDNCTSLESFKITQNIKYIGSNPFTGCDIISLDGENEKYVTIDDCLYSKDKKILISYNSYKSNNTILNSVQTIGENAFSGNKELSSLTISDNVTSINERAFADCKLKIIKLPKRLKYLGDSAFFNCTNLVSLSIPGGIKTIEFNTCYNCKSLSKIDIHEGVNFIDSYSFDNCLSLVNLNLPGSLTTIGRGNFSNCENLISIGFKEGLEIIEDYAFSSTKNLCELHLPKSIKSIGKHAFSWNDKIVYLSLPEGLVSLDEGAFQGLTCVETIDLPFSLTSVSDKCFTSCYKLKKINIPSGTRTRFVKLLDKSLHKFLIEK